MISACTYAILWSRVTGERSASVVSNGTVRYPFWSRSEGSLRRSRSMSMRADCAIAAPVPSRRGTFTMSSRSDRIATRVDGIP